MEIKHRMQVLLPVKQGTILHTCFHYIKPICYFATESVIYAVDLVNGVIFSIVDHREKKIEMLKFSPENRFLCVFCKDASVLVYNSENMEVISEYVSKDEKSPFECGDINNLGILFFVRNHSRFIYVIDLVMNISYKIRENKPIIALTTHPTSQIIAFVTIEGDVCIMNYNSQIVLSTFSKAINVSGKVFISFNVPGLILMVSNSSGNVILYRQKSDLSFIQSGSTNLFSINIDNKLWYLNLNFFNHDPRLSIGLLSNGTLEMYGMLAGGIGKYPIFNQFNAAQAEKNTRNLFASHSANIKNEVKINIKSVIIHPTENYLLFQYEDLSDFEKKKNITSYSVFKIYYDVLIHGIYQPLPTPSADAVNTGYGTPFSYDHDGLFYSSQGKLKQFIISRGKSITVGDLMIHSAPLSIDPRRQNTSGYQSRAEISNLSIDRIRYSMKYQQLALIYLCLMSNGRKFRAITYIRPENAKNLHNSVFERGRDSVFIGVNDKYIALLSDDGKKLKLGLSGQLPALPEVFKYNLEFVSDKMFPSYAHHGDGVGLIFYNSKTYELQQAFLKNNFASSSIIKMPGNLHPLNILWQYNDSSRSQAIGAIHTEAYILLIDMNMKIIGSYKGMHSLGDTITSCIWIGWTLIFSIKQQIFGMNLKGEIMKMESLGSKNFILLGSLPDAMIVGVSNDDLLKTKIRIFPFLEPLIFGEIGAQSIGYTDYTQVRCRISQIFRRYQWMRVSPMLLNILDLYNLPILRYQFTTGIKSMLEPMEYLHSIFDFGDSESELEIMREAKKNPVGYRTSPSEWDGIINQLIDKFYDFGNYNYAGSAANLSEERLQLFKYLLVTRNKKGFVKYGENSHPSYAKILSRVISSKKIFSNSPNVEVKVSLDEFYEDYSPKSNLSEKAIVNGEIIKSIRVLTGDSWQRATAIQADAAFNLSTASSSSGVSSSSTFSSSHSSVMAEKRTHTEIVDPIIPALKKSLSDPINIADPIKDMKKTLNLSFNGRVNNNNEMEMDDVDLLLSQEEPLESAEHY